MYLICVESETVGMEIDMFNENIKFYKLCLFPFILNPVRAILILILVLISGFVPAVQMLVLAEFWNNFESTIFLFYVFIYLILLLLDLIIPSIKKLLLIQIQNNVRYHFSVSYFRKKSKLPYWLIENEKVRNLSARIESQTEEYNQIFVYLINFIETILRLFGVFLTITLFSIYAGILLVLCSLPIIYVSYKFGNRNYKLKKHKTEKTKLARYLESVLKDRAFIKERFLFSYYNSIEHMWEKECENIRKSESRLDFKRIFSTKATSLFSSGAIVLFMFFLMIQLHNNVIKIGSFAAIAQKLFSFVDLISVGVANCIFSISKSRYYIDDLKCFFSLEEVTSKDLKTIIPNKFETLEFKKVSFTYPGTSKKVLNNLSFLISAGQSYAFVGSNSAGKTTIVKLIAGLYTNYSGEILINGIDIQKISKDTLHKFVSIVFQDFAKYEISIKDNIEISQNMDIDYKIKNVLKQSNLLDKVSKLPDKEFTVLGKLEKNSIELSGGEWQDIAIARCIANNAPIRILDEPTSALDPTSEKAFYENFNILNHKKTTILISHRLGSTRFVNKIFVLNNGEIVEQGNFEDLMVKKGIYYEMFENQKSWYFK